MGVASKEKRNGIKLKATEISLIDDCFDDNLKSFEEAIESKAGALANHEAYETMLFTKRLNRILDEITKPIESYRNAELKEMWRNFYEEDSAYHVKRYFFVHNINENDLLCSTPEVKDFKVVENNMTVEA